MRSVLLCERLDTDTFTGGILDRIKWRIENATIVIAELTDMNPNVYLEVGYAWGNKKPTILLTKNIDIIASDMRGQRCIIYERIKDLEILLEKELKKIINLESNVIFNNI